MIKKLIFVAALALSTMSLTACGERIQPGNVGILVKQFGSEAGVSKEPIPTGTKYLGWGEDLVQYPVIQKTYSFEKPAKGSDAADEQISFSDKNGSPLSADVSATLKVQPKAAPALYTKYRLDFDGLLAGPIRNDMRAYIAEEAELVGVEEMFGGGRQVIIQKAYKKLSNKWIKEGVEVSQLQWLGPIRMPQQVSNSILARTQADQDVLKAEAQVLVAQAQAKQKVAEAQGDADAARIRGQALQANPSVLQQQAIEKWNGQLPTYLGSGQPVPFVTAK